MAEKKKKMKKKTKKVRVNRSKTVSLKNAVIRKKTSYLKDKLASGSSGSRQIGSFGGIVFRVAAKTRPDGTRTRKILSPSGIRQEVAGEWAEHKVIGKRTRTEFTGPALRTMQYQIVVDVQLGYKPHSILKKINQFVEKGKVDIFTLGSHKIGTGKWKMERASEAFDLVYNGGELARATLDITLSEYF